MTDTRYEQTEYTATKIGGPLEDWQNLVVVDGQQILTQCLEADTAAGTALVYETDENGHFVRDGVNRKTKTIHSANLRIMRRVEPKPNTDPSVEAIIAAQKAHYRRRADEAVGPEAKLWAELMLGLCDPLVRWVNSHAVRAAKGDVLRAVTCAAACLAAQAIKNTGDTDDYSQRKYVESLFVDELQRLMKQQVAGQTVHRTDA